MRSKVVVLSIDWHNSPMINAHAFNTLRAFRSDLHSCFSKREDALFELADAILTAGPLPSPVHLSLEPVHRRGWGSLYAALARGRIDIDRLRALLAAQATHAPDTQINGIPPVYAVDVSVWARCDAEASPDRGFYYHPSRHSAGQPIVPGWAYQWIAQLSFTRDSWTTPLDIQRVHPTQNANQVAAQQIATLVRLSKSSSLHADADADPMVASKPTPLAPLFVFDAGYDSVQLSEALDEAQASASILVRLRSGRCFYADPLSPDECGTGPGTTGGRPRRHGAKFECQNPSEWPPPSVEHYCQDVQYGVVRVRAWCGLHPKTQEHPTRGTRGPRPICRGTLVLVEVSRLPGRTRKPQVMWLWYSGPGAARPHLDLLWRAYVRRFDLEHTFRFVKQTLNWTAPRVRLPEQADKWSWLVVGAYTQLRLARYCAYDYGYDSRLPWERRQKPAHLTPYRVRRGFCSLLVGLGTPAKAPKPCGRSPGRPKGTRRGPAPRYPAIKKAA